MVRSLSILVLTTFLAGNVEAAEWFVAPGGTGNGTSGAPFGKIQDALNAAQPGDIVTIAPGTYLETLTTVRSGTSSSRITVRASSGRGSVVVTRSGRVLTVNHAYITVDGLIFDGQYGTSDTVRIASGGSFFRLASSEVRRSTHDLIDMAAPQGVVIEHCLIHHALNAAGGRTDAHGIVAGPVRNLTIRDTEIHTFSGDGFQVDPGRSSPGWSGVTIERVKFWLAPLPEAANGFAAGTVTGENAVDTKASASYGRAQLTIRDTVAWGFRNGLIGNMAAFNLKEHVDVTVDRVAVFNSEIAFRLRGAASGGAFVSIKNAVVYDVLTAFRYEDDIQNLRIWNSTVGRGVGRAFQAASSSSAGLDVRNLLVLGTLPKEASSQTNLAVMADSFVDASRHNYSLAATSPAIDAGVALSGVATDFAGVARPQGNSFDIGAYEYRYDAVNQPPSVSLTKPTNGASFTAPATIEVAASALDTDGTVTSVKFYVNGTLVGNDTSAPYAMTVTNVPSGSHTLSAVATDNTGATTTSAPVTVAVAAPPATTPTWSFTATPETILRGEASTLQFVIPTTDVKLVSIDGVRPAYTCSSTQCSGSLTVSPTKSKTYALSVTSKTGTKYPGLSLRVTVIR